MNKVYLILDDEPLTRKNIVLVDTEEQAKAIVGTDPYMSYEELETLSDEDVADMILDNLLSNMGENKAKEKIKELFPDYEV